MEQSESTVNNCLVFAVNGKRFEVSTIHPSTTVLEFLRSHTPFKGPKLSCGEGGCGACVVLLSKYNPVHDQVDDCTVSSCLTLLCSVNGCSITTTEGLGNTKDGFHPIHERFSGFHASQCGFCTPGMCMSLFSALVNAEKTPRPEPPRGFSKLKVSEAETAIAGNLCRCTGYRPIADACKSFAADVDMEDLGFNSFWRKGDSKEVKLSSLPLYNHNDEICTFPQFLKNETRSTLLLDSSRYSWYNPVTIEELQSLLGFVEDGNGTRVKLVVGNTGMGYYKEVESYDKYIDLRHIPEFSTIRRDNTGISIGATITISKAIEALREYNQSGFYSEGDMVYKKIADHMEKVASGFIRNSASLGGNLVMAQRNHFPSDIATVLLAVGSTVNIMNSLKSEELTLEEFLRRPELDSKSILFAFGAYGTKHPIRATKVEEFLTGKVLSVGVLCEAVKLLRGIVVPDDGTSSPAYRSSLAVSFLFEFFSHLLDHGKISTLLSSAKQEVELNRQYRPVGEPIAKSGAAIQASGEAVYVDDIPSPTNCLHGAFIYGTKPLARVKGIKLNPKSVAAGVSALISFKDIPGENIGCKTMFGTEPLFADDFTRCAGEYIAFVVADTQKHANMAANLAVIDYDMENLEPPILSVEEAVRRSSFFEVPSIISPKQVGDFSRGMAEADHKILSAEIRLGSQYYFYMETQTALAVPDEDNCIVVYSSIQCPENAHTTISRCLGIPEHNVRVITRRVGGGFGGKAMKAIAVATACALAAYKLQRPVRIYMNRKTDMKIAGGRHPMKVQATFISEAVIEHVASTLSMDVDSVRSGNLHTFNSLNFFFEGCADFLEKVRVIQSDTLSLIQGGLTTASTTSECSCEAIRLCCNMLVKRLTPIKERLQEQMGSVEWGTLILQAQSQAVNLSASSYYVPDFSSFQYLNYGAAVSEVEVNLLTGQTTILQSDIIYDCGQSLNPAVDLGQIEGAFVQGIGFFMLEEYTTNSDGLVVTEGTWTYKIPTIDTIPKQFNVEVLNSGHHKNRVLSSKASGEPPLLLAVSVHCATRAAIREARQQLLSWTGLTKCDSTFQLEVPATMPVVKELCGLENVESYLQSLLS
ncbi:unnamed protein product, partial [Vitis vinifera]